MSSAIPQSAPGSSEACAVLPCGSAPADSPPKCSQPCQPAAAGCAARGSRGATVAAAAFCFIRLAITPPTEDTTVAIHLHCQPSPTEIVTTINQYYPAIYIQSLTSHLIVMMQIQHLTGLAVAIPSRKVSPSSSPAWLQRGKAHGLCAQASVYGPSSAAAHWNQGRQLRRQHGQT